MQTEAVKELVAAAEECASRRYEPRLSKAVAAVKAEEKPQTHDFQGNMFLQCQHPSCGQMLDAPIHQERGK
jgi:phage baseplate assembly protein W